MKSLLLFLISCFFISFISAAEASNCTFNVTNNTPYYLHYKSSGTIIGPRGSNSFPFEGSLDLEIFASIRSDILFSDDNEKEKTVAFTTIHVHGTCNNGIATMGSCYDESDNHQFHKKYPSSLKCDNPTAINKDYETSYATLHIHALSIQISPRPIE
jgi:hypothetical protein